MLSTQLHCCDDAADLILNSHLKARSQDGGVGLSARDSRDGRSEADTLPPRDDHTPERLATRQAVREFMDTVASINARESEVKQEARGLSNDAIEVEERDINPIDSRAAPMTTDEIINALLSRREPDSGQDVQARGFMELIELGASVLGNFLRRDVAPENLLARTDLDELVNSITRRNSISEQQMNARGSFEDLLQALSTSSRRDVESEELFARDNFNDLLNSLKAPSRELGFIRDMQARGFFYQPSGVGPA